MTIESFNMRNKAIKGECHHHTCYKEIYVKKCRFCNNHFCKEHYRPKPPNFSPFRKDVDVRAFREGGHPDMAYWRFLEEKERKAEKRYEEALKRLTSKPIRHAELEQEISEVKSSDSEPINFSYSKKKYYSDSLSYKSKRIARKIWDSVFSLFVIAIMIIVVVFVLNRVENPSSISSLSSSLNPPKNNFIELPKFEDVTSTIVNKPEINTNELELEIHNLINSERQSRGLAPLKLDTKLSFIARIHSQDMGLRKFFDHINPDGEDPTARGLVSGYSCRKDYGSYYTNGLAENIFQNNLYDSVTYYNGIPSYDWNTQKEIAESTASGWMSSTGHRQNILTSTYDRQGIGVAISSDDKVYITEDFC